jgi:hypothetical protein
MVGDLPPLDALMIDSYTRLSKRNLVTRLEVRANAGAAKYAAHSARLEARAPTTPITAYRE